MKNLPKHTKKTIAVLVFSFMACVGAVSPGCSCDAHATERSSVVLKGESGPTFPEYKGHVDSGSVSRQ